jgi:hypothetical protein
MSPTRLAGLIAVFAMSCPFAVVTEAQTEHEADEMAYLIAEAATCIFYPHFDAVTPDEMFDERELEILESYTDQINVMIRAALGIGDSICGAYFSQLFGLQQNLDLLRWHILEPGRFYGWEGSYRADGEHIYSDEQYVYTSKYIPVAESLAGESIEDIIRLTDQEKERILSIANDANHESYEWALWILRKLAPD